MARTIVWSLWMGAVAATGAVAIGATGSSVAEPTNPALRMAIEGRVDPLAAAPDLGAASGESAAAWTAAPQALDTLILTSREAPIRLNPEMRPDPFADPISDEAQSQTYNLEYALSAPARQTGLDLDVAIAPRAGFALGPEGGQLRSLGGEVRLGRRLEKMVGEFTSAATWDRPAWYFFAATDGSALTWTPEAMAGAARRGLSYQEDRVIIGDAQIGVSVEARGMQASFSVMNRNVSNGWESMDENYVGASITMRR
ncbi:MAG: hypothetical protein IV086_14960 [Hyphomonadaceae bacterium]|nr:MAG: hypothetical protein FD160_3431 [Caulobacteraceae bacterium]MBT9446999.1 hypothetical protein [Hyphomonadaceae bacterium]TPW08808.1 MAG: hypothetical protein FD124_86 [Alphaproteobacteria bacterium]